LREAITAAMNRSGVGQRELCRRIGQTYTFVNKVLAGKVLLEVTELIDIARALDMDPAELLGQATGKGE
jgi:transcriptional regulator with XRE-family HTH domain